MKKAMPIFVTVIFFIFIISYISYPIKLLPLPVGWDTPRYVWHMRALARDWRFISEMDFNNFIYPLLGSLLIKLGIDAFFVEILLPPLLLLTLLIETFLLLTLLQPNVNWKIYTFVALSWFCAFRVAADLHSNLLALNLLLPLILFLNDYLKKGKSLYLGIVTFLQTLSSFTHIESTLFLTSILFLTILTERGLSKIKRVAITTLLLITILPAATLYYIHIRKLLMYSGGSFKGSTMDLWTWLFYLGPAGLIGVYQLIDEARFIRFINVKALPKRFFTIWGFVSITFGLIQYLEPSFAIFSERALIMFPTPFLAIQKIEKVENLVQKIIKSSLRVRLKFSPLALITVLMVFNLLAALYGGFYNITICPEMYEKMLFLKHEFRDKPIIIVTDYKDRYAGELSLHYYDWSRAIIGNTYVYVGSIYYLRDQIPTPFFYWSSRQASNILFQKICSDLRSFDDAVVVYGRLFTDFPDIPRGFKVFLEQLEDDLYVVNVTKLRETEGVSVIPVLQYSKVIYGNWYASNKSFGDYPLTFECWMTGEIPKAPAIEVLFAVKDEGKYIISLSFWGNETTSLRVQVDDNQPLMFNATGKPEKEIVFTGFLGKGEHLLKIALLCRNAINKYLRARLNVLEISRVSNTLQDRNIVSRIGRPYSPMKKLF